MYFYFFVPGFYIFGHQLLRRTLLLLINIRQACCGCSA